MKWDELVASAIAAEASDILLSPGNPPVLRIRGQWTPQPGAILDDELVGRVLDRVAPPGGLETLRAKRDFDFATELQGRRFRGNAFLRRGAAGLALRLLPARIPSPSELGLPDVLSELVLAPHGLILFTGAAGQGKSTSQASLLHHLNEQRARHVITLEDPIEFVHAPIRSIFEQREVGRDTDDFASGLRHVLRQAPDVVLVGEMRDGETVQAVLSIAETGHLVLSTLHTNDAVQAIARILDAVPESARLTVRTQLSLALAAVVHQRLIPGIDGRLRLACEILINTPAVSAQIREGHLERIYSTMELDQRSGMITLNRSLASLVSRGEIDVKLAERMASSHESLNLPARNP